MIYKLAKVTDGRVTSFLQTTTVIVKKEFEIDRNNTEKKAKRWQTLAVVITVSIYSKESYNGRKGIAIVAEASYKQKEA